MGGIERAKRLADRGNSATPWALAFWALFQVLCWSGIAGGAVIRDLAELSQDPLTYLDPNTANAPLLPLPEQARLSAEFKLLYFAPWHRTEPHHPKEMASFGFRKYVGIPGYGKGGRSYPADWIGKTADNARVEDFGKKVFPAVTVNPVDFRILPTSEPHSRQPRNFGEAYPFDNFQESTAPVGMPVLVTLESRDRQWFLAETSHLLGWVRAADIAAVDPEFIRRWEEGRCVAVIRDKAPVTVGTRTPFRAPMGAIFSMTGGDGAQAQIWTAARDAHGKAVLQKGAVPNDAVAELPISFTPGRVARLAREIAGEPYGWGGLYGRRDCSALVRDIFTPFGIWLPRNSGDQAIAWKFISFRKLSPSKKEALILRRGVPWRTLLWTPGHIMLYIGSRNGKPLIFHNFWSVTTREPDGTRDKVIVGRAAVTTLYPGRELKKSGVSRNGLLDDLQGMTLIGEPPEDGLAPQGPKP